MTIDEAIELHKKEATIITNGDNHQIAEWLEELKVLREKAKGDKWYQKGRADALKPIAKIIDDFVCGRIELSINALNKIQHSITEQLKEQK